jgi:hypothetical protein
MAIRTTDYEILLKMRADIAQALGQLDRAKDKTKQFGDAAGTATARMSSLLGSVKTLAGAIAIGFAVHEVADFTRYLVGANEQLFQMVKRAEGLNVSVKFLSGLSEQADDLGINIQQLAVVFGTLNRQIATAQNGSASAKTLFKDFGVDPDKAKSTEEIFLGIADSVEKYGLNVRRAGELTQIFGASGKDIVPILKQGATTIRAQNDAMAKTGQIISDDAVPNIVELHNATDAIGDSFTALRNNLIVQLAPAISDIADQFNDFVNDHGPALTSEIADIVAKLPALARGFGDVANAAVTVASKVGGFVEELKGMAEYAAKVQHGAGGDDLGGLLVEQDDIQAELRQRQKHPALSAINTFLAGTENNPVQNFVEGGRARIQSMSTDALNARLDEIQAQVFALEHQKKPFVNPQEGDNRGLYISEGGGTSTTPPASTNTSANAEAAAIAKQAAAAQAALTQSLIDFQSQLSPAAAIYAKYNEVVKKATEEAELAKQAQGANAQAIELQKRAVIDLAGTQRDAALAALAHSNAQKSLAAAMQQVNGILDDQARQEQQIQAEQQAGLISEYTARRRIIALHQQTAQALDALLPKLREMVAATGDPQALENLKNLEAQIAQLKIQANDTAQALQSGFESGLEQGLEGLAMRTMSVADAFRTLALSVAQSLAQVAARALAAKATDAISGLLGHGDGSQDMAQGATKVTSASVVLAGASVALGINADKLQRAATTLAIANGLSLAAGHAEGGLIVGPGTPTSDSIPARLSNGEWVMKTAAVKHYGVGFMAQVNQMRFADGGLAFADAPSPGDLGFRMPATARTGDLSAAADANRAPTVNFRNVNVVDPEMVTGAMNSAAGETVILNVISRNAVKIKQRLY